MQTTKLGREPHLRWMKRFINSSRVAFSPRASETSRSARSGIQSQSTCAHLAFSVAEINK